MRKTTENTEETEKVKTAIPKILVAVLCLAAAFIAFLVGMGRDPLKPLDPRAPPADVSVGSYSYEKIQSETWNNFPVDGGTVAARTATAGGTEASSLFNDLDEELFDYAPRVPPRVPPCDGSCRAPVPFARATDPRATPPAPAFFGERAPFWYEREGIYNEPDYPEPEVEREGLFSRIRARRNGR